MAAVVVGKIYRSYVRIYLFMFSSSKACFLKPVWLWLWTWAQAFFSFSASGETIMEEAEQWGLVRQTEDDEWGAEVELVGGLCKQS